jgi:hypothetical protein
MRRLLLVCLLLAACGPSAGARQEEWEKANRRRHGITGGVTLAGHDSARRVACYRSDYGGAHLSCVKY